MRGLQTSLCMGLATPIPSYGQFDLPLDAMVLAITDNIATVGHRKGTHRESTRRPAAYLYARPTMANEESVQRLARPQRGRVVADMLVDEWLRMNGPPAGGYSRYSSRRSAGGKASIGMAWALNPCLTEVGMDLEWIHRCARVGCIVTGKRDRWVLADHIERLVLGWHLEPYLVAGIGFALAGEEPMSGGWHAHVDAALETGQPWAERLALLSQRPDSDVLVRCLRWVYELPAAPGWAG